MLHEGEPLGAIVVGWAEPGPVSKIQEELLKTFSDQAVIAIENVRLLDRGHARSARAADGDVGSAAHYFGAHRARSGQCSRPCSRAQHAFARPGLGYIVPPRRRQVPRGWRYSRRAARLCRSAQAWHRRAPTAAGRAHLGVSQAPSKSCILPTSGKLQSYVERHPFVAAAVELGGFRTALAVPMLKDGEPSASL